MNSTFHFRDKIAVCLRDPPTELRERLAAHPWFTINTDPNSPLIITTETTSEPIGQSVVIDLGSRAYRAVSLDLNGGDLNDGNQLKLSIPSEVAIGLAMALKPLQDTFGLKSVQATILAPVLGAPKPLASIELMDNVIPGLDEANTLKCELKQLIGLQAPFASQVLHVPMSHGTAISVFVEFGSQADIAAITSAWQTFQGYQARGELPSCQATPLVYRTDPNFPQPRMQNANTATLVGQLRASSATQFQFLLVTPNRTSQLLLLAESLVVTGKLFW